jgi:hypothetical protein
MIAWIRRIKERYIENKERIEYERAVEELRSPTLFTPMQRDALLALFPKAWTHMDNFTQEEVFKIAVTMTLFGMSCETPEKMKAVMDLLVVQNIYREYGSNPMVIKRC